MILIAKLTPYTKEIVTRIITKHILNKKRFAFLRIWEVLITFTKSNDTKWKLLLRRNTYEIYM